MDNVRPLKTDADYDWAVAEVESYFIDAPEPGSPNAERFDLLCDLIEAYDAKHYPIPDADPIDILVSFMDDKGWKAKDLADIVGQKSRASEILNKKRPLSLAMIQKITQAWSISADLLVKPYALSNDRTGTLRQVR